MCAELINQTKEEALERIFSQLSGGAGYENVTYLKNHEDHRNFDPVRALDTDAFVDFIKESQPKQYKALTLSAPDTADYKLIDEFVKSVESKGLLEVLKHGFVVLGRSFKPFISKPENSEDLEAEQLYNKNKFYCARQFHYSKNESKKSIDIVLLINGIPIVAIEVKNYFTGQSADDAVAQFCKDRDQTELMFKINHRCLVMFAVDNYEVMMTTCLEGNDTHFIPFNQGSNGPGNVGRAGNPIKENAISTDYLFTEVLAKDSLSRILIDYMVCEEDGKKQRVIFPRYHQYHCVETFLERAQTEGPGHNYLIQHSAGSGKSNTIAWLAFRLLYLQKNGHSIFDSVLICVHRTVLNEQLNKTVDLFGYEKNSIALVNSAAELREALANGNKIIVTTIQKFGQFNESLKLYKRNYAIIFDEAHTTSTGKLNTKTKMALGERALKENDHEILAIDYDTEEEILKAYEKIKYEGIQDNLSFYAFTATPTHKTLTAFGKRNDDGSYSAHHNYSMLQAMDEHFICNVLEDYMTYRGYREMLEGFEKSKDELVDKEKAQKILNDMVRKDESVILKKSRIIVQYFRDVVANELGGHAKAMIVVEGRDNVLNYRDGIIKASQEANYDGIRSMVAFSGTLEYDDKKVKENDFNFLNGKKIKTSEMPDAFDTDTFNLMIAADKFQVGFDQPKLTTMFIDKKLSGVEAVQTISRLNRVIPGREKHTHVLDFVNKREEIMAAFAPYYLETITEVGYDPGSIYTKLLDLESFQVIDKDEVKKFASVFCETDPDALQKISNLLDPARQRFMMLSSDDQDNFKKRAKTLMNQYKSVTVANNFIDPYFHDLVDFIDYLLKVLPRNPKDPLPDIVQLVSLNHYRLVETGSGPIQIGPNTPLPHPSSNPKLNTKKKEFLTEIIRKMNQRWGLPDFNDEDKLTMFKCVADDIAEKISKSGNFEEYSEWTSETFDKQFHEIAKSELLNHAMQNSEFINALIKNVDDFNDIVTDILNYVHYTTKHQSDKN